MKRSAQITLIFLFLSFAAAGIVSRVVFERLPHLEDEFAYQYQARLFAHGDVSTALIRPIRAYWQPFLITADTNGDKTADIRFGKYTPGWPLIMAVGELLNQSWIVNGWLAMLTVAVVYRLGREIYNPPTGAVAALLTATSPAALLLNGTMMGHSASLFFATLFMYALWRVEKFPRRALVWGLVAGSSLGLLVITRPLTAVAVAAPFVLYSGIRVIAAFISRRTKSLNLRSGFRTLTPLLALAVLTILIGLLWPAFNYSVVRHQGESFPHFLTRFLEREKDTDLYRYIWDYDRVGFGLGYGRNAKTGHTIELGWKHSKSDLTCAARDLYGWARPADAGLNAEVQQKASDACLRKPYGHGYSWLLLPLGFLLLVYRRWTWLFAVVPICVVGVYIAYWIGGDLYSARYIYEALTAVTILSAAGLVALAHTLDFGILYLTSGRKVPLSSLAGEGDLGGEVHHWPSLILYTLLAAVTIYSLTLYSPRRILPLKGYGRISQGQIDQVETMRRDPSKPLAIIAWGKSHWRDTGPLMALTDPYLDNDIILAREPDWNQANLDQIRADLAGHEIIYFMHGAFMYDLPTDLYTQDGYHFFFYDTEANEAPHIHVGSPAGQAKFWLDPVELEWNNGFTEAHLNDILNIVTAQRTAFLTAWNTKFAQTDP
ncbi:MAG TPA: DUF4160 domain-containing protein [Aggregatilineaceae bacterium]|nr:DUF4160 domain-containing protein [Aggregatilineaceae bacterium]